MLSTPEIIQVNAHLTAVIHLTIARGEMMKAFGPAVVELMAALASQRVKPIGAVFAHHLKMSPITFDFELGVKVATSVAASGRVAPGQLPSAKVARTVYSGSYEGLPSAWSEFSNWVKAHGYAPADDLWELYSVGPQSTPVPADWRTELVRPLND